MKPMLVFFSVAALFFSAACAPTHQYVPFPDLSVPVENRQKARIYVLRPATMGGALSISVRDGEREIGKTGGRAFLCWERKAGENARVVAVTESAFGSKVIPQTSGIGFEVEEGKAYYVIMHIRLWGRTELEIADEMKGKRVLVKCRQPKVETCSEGKR